MLEPITKQELIDASADALALEQVVNGTDTSDVTSRLARTYPTLAKAMRLIVENGLLGATPFNLGSQMIASGLANGSYAVVTDDPNPEINGFYQRQSGLWEFLAWNPLSQSKAYVNANRLFKPVALTAAADFNTLVAEGRTVVPTNAIAAACTNRPSSNAGVLDVALVGSGVFQVYRVFQFDLAYERQRLSGGTWTAWVQSASKDMVDTTAANTLQGAKDYADANRQFKPIKLGNVSLNTLTTVGIYFGTDTGQATLANNYPAAGAAGVIRVLQASGSSLIYHEFKGTNGTDYWRVYNGSTWSAWSLSVDLSTYAKKTYDFNDLGVLVADVNLDTLTAAGRWFLGSGGGIATVALNYPADGVAGALEVLKNAASSVIIQRFTAAGSTTPIAYYRMLRSGTWSPWQTDKHAIPTGLLDSGRLGTSNLNTFTTTGFYVQGTSGDATLALNYPETTSGFLEVIKTITSGLITQRYTSSSNKIYLRNGNISSFGAWVEVGGAGINTAKIVSVMTNAINADDLKTEFATYIVNSIILDLTLTNLPVQSYGILTVYKGTVSSFAMQSFLTNAGVVYARHWNGSVWSAWSIPASGGGSAVDDTITFTKTASVLQWTLANSGSGTNKIRHAYNRGITPATNRDSWGMGKAVLVTEAGATVNDLTTTGVWECAIIDSENVGDHSGGGHGDEVKNLSYFLVDGIYRTEGFVENFKAKEVKHIQHSTIYVENQMTPICRRETVWTFNKNGCTSKTKLIFDTVRTINKARIAMLPIYRKANTDGTGVQITDTEIRSQDDLVIDVSAHGFTLRDLPIADNDSILLSSAVSNISAEVKVKHIDVPSAYAYVQNTILYNKVYVNAFAETAPAYVTTAGEVWQIETGFVFKVRS